RPHDRLERDDVGGHVLDMLEHLVEGRGDVGLEGLHRLLHIADGGVDRRFIYIHVLVAPLKLLALHIPGSQARPRAISRFTEISASTFSISRVFSISIVRLSTKRNRL